MSIFRFIMCLEAHYICMVKHEFQHTALFGNQKNLFAMQ